MYVFETNKVNCFTNYDKKFLNLDIWKLNDKKNNI